MRWVAFLPLLLLGGLIVLHYYLQSQLHHYQLERDKLNVKLLSMKKVSDKDPNYAKNLLKQAHLNQTIKHLLQASLLSPTIKIYDVQIKNNKLLLKASSYDSRTAILFANHLKLSVITHIKWNALTRSFVFQLSLSF